MRNEFNNLYEFAEFRFDGKKGKLWRDSEQILLSPKAIELLTLLLEKQGMFVSKEEIFETVWKNTFVEDGVLTQNIYTLRKALGKDAGGEHLIENKTRLGYRIIVPINKIEQTNGNLPATSATPQNESNYEKTLPIQINKTRRSRKKTALIFAAILIVFLPAVFFGYHYFRPQIAAFFRKPIEKVRFSQLTNTGDLTNAVISPDGTLLAFNRGDNIFLKDILTEKEIKLEIPIKSLVPSLLYPATISLPSDCSPHSKISLLLALPKFEKTSVSSVPVAESRTISPFLGAKPEPFELQPIYTTAEGEIFNFAWSKDGKKIVISRGQQFRDAVLLTEFDK